MGAMASGGRVMGWICIVVGCLETLAMLIPVAAFIITIIFVRVLSKLKEPLRSGVYPHPAHVSSLRQNVGVS